MKLHPQATKGHLMVGIALILLSLGSLIASLILDTQILPILNFFFGVWGGIETGRYLEAWMSKRHAEVTAWVGVRDWAQTLSIQIWPGNAELIGLQ